MTSPQTCVLTGANSGIGYATAHALIQRGWHVIMLCRNTTKGSRAAQQLNDLGPGHATLITCDLTAMRTIERAAQRLHDMNTPIDVFIHNAGCLTLTRKVSSEGWEYCFAVNDLGPWYLTRLMLPRLLNHPSPRMILAGSAAHARGRIDLMHLNNHRGIAAYNHSKLANALFCIEFARRYGDHIVTVCADPGMAATGFGGNLGWATGTVMQLVKPFLPSAASAARTVLQCATAPRSRLSNGECYRNQRAIGFAMPESQRWLEHTGTSAGEWTPVRQAS